MQISIIDYGLGNLYSLLNAFMHCGVEAVITNDPQKLSKSDVLVLPGVGAFRDGMAKLKTLRIDKIIKDHVLKKKLILGICLGMQLLFKNSEEFGQHQGLGLIEGEVKYFTSLDSFDHQPKIPHIGWNEVKPIGRSHLTKNLNHKDMYFAHSLCVLTGKPEATLATASYGNIEFAVIIAKDNIIGCQFHPEKSSSGGLTFISNFIEMARKRI